LKNGQIHGFAQGLLIFLVQYYNVILLVKKKNAEQESATQVKGSPYLDENVDVRIGCRCQPITKRRTRPFRIFVF